jgi:hypothetical protein
VTAAVPVTFADQTEEIIVPLEALGGDDGNINVATVLGDFFQPTDWAPDIGHGTIQPFSDAPWLSRNRPKGRSSLATTSRSTSPSQPRPDAGRVPRGPRPRDHGAQGAEDHHPGDADGHLPAGFGAITGTVSDAHGGEPLGDVA